MHPSHPKSVQLDLFGPPDDDRLPDTPRWRSLPDRTRRRAAVLFQDFFRYDLSAADNVGFGEVRALGNRDRIQVAAKQAGAHDIIEALPKGYDTVLGRTFDEGVDLSGGEWQHLAISRAFLSDAQIIILDEPTAALDAFREHHLYEQVADLSTSKTVVFISHRFSTVRMADLIVVVEDGRVTELGDHETLTPKTASTPRCSTPKRHATAESGDNTRVRSMARQWSGRRSATTRTRASPATIALRDAGRRGEETFRTRVRRL